jgi:hypothetical protein
VDRSFRGDIETIVSKALEKDKTRRYGSAAELASEIRRYLKDEPIVARPPSAKYQLQKFARRNKAFVTGLVTVLVALIGGGVATSWQAVHAGHAERVAVLERNRATEAEAAAKAERDRALAAEDKAIKAEEQIRQERDNAVAERQRADAEAATTNSLRLIRSWQSLAREALRPSSTRSDDNLGALRALAEALQEQGGSQGGSLPTPRFAAISPNGQRLATVDDKGIHVWDARNPSDPVPALR